MQSVKSDIFTSYPIIQKYSGPIVGCKTGVFSVLNMEEESFLRCEGE